MSDSMTGPHLTVYIPTWNRPHACLDQVQRLADQRGHINEDCHVRIVVAVNGDPQYDTEKLHQAGADIVIQRPVNLGGNANICLAFEYLALPGHLWLLSDDDPIVDTALASIIDVIERDPSVDAIFFAEVESAGQIPVPRSVEGLGDFPIASVSCTVYRGPAFVSYVEEAFRSIVTFFPHVALIDAALAAGTIGSAWTLPLDRVVDLTPMRQEAVMQGRAAMGRRTGGFFFGGGLLTYLDTDPARRRRRTRLWWRTHWHRLSMYRRAKSAEGVLVDAGGRAKLTTAGWWLLSLPPWWRYKDWRSRGS